MTDPSAADPLWEQAKHEFPNDLALRRIRYRELTQPKRATAARWRCWLGRHRWQWKHDGRVMELRCVRCRRWRPWGKKQRRWEVMP